MSIPCQDWNEEVERTEQLYGSTCSLSSKSCVDALSKPRQDRKKEEEEEVENKGPLQNSEIVPQRDYFAVPHQDWCEEVERSERLEACAGSEAPTRSSSPMSRTADSDIFKKPLPAAQWKKPRRRYCIKEFFPIPRWFEVN